jgi:ribosomal protein S28E/S33
LCLAWRSGADQSRTLPKNAAEPVRFGGILEFVALENVTARNESSWRYCRITWRSSARR